MTIAADRIAALDFWEQARRWIGSSYVWVIGLAIVVFMLWQSNAALNAERQRFGEIALRSYNQAAKLDQSRRVSLTRRDSIRILGDSIGAVTKLATQGRQKSTALDGALGVERKTTAELRDSIKALQVVAQSGAPVITDASNTRIATYDVHETPWTLHAVDSLPATGSGKLHATVSIDAATLTVSHGCEKANSDGIRPARVTVTGPPWLSTTIVNASQDTAVCPSPALAGPSHPWWVPALRPQLAFGYGTHGWQGMVTLVRWPSW